MVRPLVGLPLPEHAPHLPLLLGGEVLEGGQGGTFITEEGEWAEVGRGGSWLRVRGGEPLAGRLGWPSGRAWASRAGREVGMAEWAMVGTDTAMMACAWLWAIETLGGVLPMPEARMTAAAAAEAAGKVPSAGTRGVRNTAGEGGLTVLCWCNVIVR